MCVEFTLTLIKNIDIPMCFDGGLLLYLVKIVQPTKTVLKKSGMRGTLR